jgi:hypothetical protein
MRTEQVNGRWLLCGAILPKEKIEVGQTWASGNTVVQVTDVDQFGWVRYCWTEKGQVVCNEKEAFAFQCRYCLVLPSQEIPEELTCKSTQAQP